MSATASEEFQMKFVKPNEGEPEPALLEAFEMLKEHSLTPEWIDQDQCLSVEGPDKNCAFVIDPFQGPAFEHLKLLACRVYGAQCILASLTMKVQLPQKKRPIYNVAMKGVTISCTSLNKTTRDHVHQLVELMAGEASRNLTEDVTHLVAGEVGSQKYAVAASRGTPIMTVDWVHAVWEKAKHRYIHGMDTDFAKFRCPIFKGLVVTVSGLSPEERRKVKQYVESEGGTYTGEMKMNECTHLILKEPKGQKYDYASKWKIHIVTLRWLYESLDKNFCQDEKNYPVTGSVSSGVKTSTPERSRLSVIKPNIADISAISTAPNDETAFMRTRLGETVMENFETLELTSVPGESFLHSCRVYLSQGIGEPLLEKCQRIITVGGAKRFDELSENVTHVVMEEKVDNEINTISNMELRPHVVNAMWLAECFRQTRLVSEEQFLSPHFLLSEIELPKLQVSDRKSNQREKRKSKEGSKSGETPSTSKPVAENRDDDDMEQLLSQYMDQSTLEEETKVQPMDEVDGDTSASTSKQGGTNVDDDADATQDPANEVTAAGGGIFQRKLFTFCGFSEEDVAALSEFVTQAGGVCIKEGGRKIPDYAVVPILGCLVEQTVGEVVTNAWLQMCLEAEELLSSDSHPLFHPMDIDESARPLEGCVVSVSGYFGVERDCLTHIADLLGAVCQEYFVRRANKTLQASTHLIVKEASGSKYSAAVKWNIPAVTKEWLFACAKSGQREAEEKFSIDNSSNSSISAQSTVRQQVTTVAQTVSSTSDKHGPGKGTEDDTVPQAGVVHVTSAEAAQPNSYSRPHLPQEEAGAHSESSNTGDADAQKNEKQTCRQRSLVELVAASSSAESVRSITTSGAERIPSSATSDQESGAVRSDHLANPMSSAKVMVQQQQSQGTLSQKENIATTVVRKRGLATPRVEELQQQSRKPILSPGTDSPSVFLAPGYRPKFDLQGVYDYLKSPDVPQKKRDSLPLEEVFQYHLAEGVKNTALRQNVDPVPACSQQSQSDLQPEDLGPLEGVMISVSKKLGMNQTEYNSIVVELGGDYSWQYSTSCTHFIFQGRANDLNKEFRQAKSQGKFIVSPHWLYACMEQRGRVDESMYPHNYNPSLNLGGIVRTETPGRGLRRSARNTPKPNHEGSDPRTPTRPSPEPKTPAKAAEDVWQESMNEMKKWQSGQSSKTAKDSGKKRLESVTEVISTNKVPSEAEEKRLSTGMKEQSVSSSSLSSNDDKSVRNSTAVMSAKSGEELGEQMCQESDSHQQEKEEAVKEVVAAEGGGGGSLEIREALSKTLEKVKASSSRSKKSSKKRNRRAEGNSSGGQLNNSGNLSDATGHHTSPWPTRPDKQDVTHTTESVGNEASQSLQVTWDDPTGRQEKERLAHKLEMVCGPSQNTQNTEDFMANMAMPDLDNLPDNQQTEEASRQHQQDRSPTPEPPPLAFPAARCVSKISSPKPVELLSDESSDGHTEHSAKPIILISGMAPQERIEFAEVIERLGGTVLEKQQFDPSCTHVVVIKPSRNEKFLAAVATGRWVLHKSYLIACRQEGRFVREEDHEWGNPAMSHLMQNLDSQMLNLVQAAYSWRQKVQGMKKADPNCQGAFQGWRVVLLTERKREDNFRRLLSAGGATVLNVRPPFTELDATHAFVELHKVTLSQNDLEVLASGVDYVLKPEYIAAHLTDPAPVPENFTAAGVEKLQANRPSEDPSSKKRKSSQLGDSGASKRSRR